MATYFHFREFPVYKDSRELRKEIKLLVKNHFPASEDYKLSSQLIRAMDSVLLNIAEGSERYSKLDFSRFLNNSITSINEVVACLDAASDDQYISDSEYEYFLKKVENISRQLKAFCAKIRSTK